MLRRALPLFAAFVLVAGPAFAADPGARTPITVGAAVNDVALAATAGTLGVVTQDPGGRLSLPPAPSAPVWYLYSPDGRNLIQDGDADVDGCDSGTTLDDCTSHATNVALSADGTRMVVASVADDNNPILTFVRDASGNLAAVRGSGSVTMQGTVADLAMSEDGQTVAVLSNSGTASVVGHVYVFNWASGSSTTPSLLWSDDLSGGAATDLAMSPDGQSLAVTQGTSHHRYKRSSAGTQVTDANFSGNGVDVAIANGAKHLSVAGSSAGWFILYQDDTPGGNREVRIRDAVDVSLDAVAIRVDATAVALGNAAGDLWVYKVATDTLLTSLVGKVSLGAPVREVAFARDGQSLAVAYGNNVGHYAVEATSLVKLWSAPLSSSAGDVAIDEHGERVAAGNASQAIVYEAKHKVNVLTPTLPAATPGQTVSIVASYVNAGNRMAAAAIAVEAPTGWTAIPDKTSFRIAPDQTVTVRLNVTVPAAAPPGSKDVRLLNSLGPAGSSTTTLSFTVPTIEAWDLDVEGAASIGIQSGGANAFALEVANKGNLAKQPPIALSVSPQGWTATLVGNEGALDPGARRDLAISVQAPQDAAPGAQGTVTVTLPQATGSPLTLVATVGASFGLDLAGPSSASLEPGEATRVTLTLRNTGNAPDTYTVEAANLPSGWTASVPASPFSLANGQSAQVEVVILVPSDESMDNAVELTVTARSSADPGKSDDHRFLASLPQDGSGSESKTGTKSKDSPGVGPAVLLAGLAALAWAIRKTK